MNNEEAQGFKSLANQLEQFSDYQQNKLDQSYENQMKAYAQDLETDVIENISRLSIEHANDFSTFSSLASVRKKATLNNITNSAVKQQVGLYYDRQMAVYGEKVYRNSFELEQIQKTQQIYKDIKTHTDNTQAMVVAAVRNGLMIDNEDFIQQVGQDIDNQGLYLDSKFALMPAQTTKTGIENRTKAQNKAKITLYQTAIIEVAKMAEEGGGSGIQVLLDFEKNPTKFFKQNILLSTLFPDGGASLSEDEQQSIILKSKEMILLIRDEQERKYDANIKAHTLESSKQYTLMLQNHVQTPGSITPDMVIESYNNGSLTEKDHNTLLKVLQSESYYKEDDSVKIELNEKLFDPAYDQFELYDDIKTAVELKQISIPTHSNLLSKLRSGTLNDIKKTPYYSEALNNIKNNLRTTGPGAMFYKAGEDRDIALAAEDLYTRVIGGEKPIDIWRDILTQYKPNWNKTQDDGNDAARQELARKRQAGELSKEQFHEAMEKLRNNQ
ncbi:MAG: hypothetical protein ABGX60_00010 [Candidatus Thioglobus sp.]